MSQRYIYECCVVPELLDQYTFNIKDIDSTNPELYFNDPLKPHQKQHQLELLKDIAQILIDKKQYLNKTIQCAHPATPTSSNTNITNAYIKENGLWIEFECDDYIHTDILKHNLCPEVSLNHIQSWTEDHTQTNPELIEVSLCYPNEAARKGTSIHYKGEKIKNDNIHPSSTNIPISTIASNEQFISSSSSPPATTSLDTNNMSTPSVSVPIPTPVTNTPAVETVPIPTPIEQEPVQLFDETDENIKHAPIKDLPVDLQKRSDESYNDWYMRLMATAAGRINPLRFKHIATEVIVGNQKEVAAMQQKAMQDKLDQQQTYINQMLPVLKSYANGNKSSPQDKQLIEESELESRNGQLIPDVNYRRLQTVASNLTFYADTAPPSSSSNTTMSLEALIQKSVTEAINNTKKRTQQELMDLRQQELIKEYNESKMNSNKRVATVAGSNSFYSNPPSSINHHQQQQYSSNGPMSYAQQEEDRRTYNNNALLQMMKTAEDISIRFPNNRIFNDNANDVYNHEGNKRNWNVVQTTKQQLADRRVQEDEVYYNRTHSKSCEI